MSFSAQTAARLNDEAVARVMLAELDTTQGYVRLMIGEDWVFRDVNGLVWAGGEMLSIGDVESSMNGNAPMLQLVGSYAYDPDAADLVNVVRGYGVAAIENRPLKLYFQYFGQHEEKHAPIDAPVLIATRTMRKIEYGFEGAQRRSITLTCEGPNALRARPVNGRYTDADQRRRASGDPSLEFVPTNSNDDEPLFAV